jgi:hypothetical protein
MRRWTKQIRALELFGEKNPLGRGSNLGQAGGNLCLSGPERFFSIVRNAQYTYPLFGRAIIIWFIFVDFSQSLYYFKVFVGYVLSSLKSIPLIKQKREMLFKWLVNRPRRSRSDYRHSKMVQFEKGIRFYCPG